MNWFRGDEGKKVRFVVDHLRGYDSWFLGYVFSLLNYSRPIISMRKRGSFHVSYRKVLLESFLYVRNALRFFGKVRTWIEGNRYIASVNVPNIYYALLLESGKRYVLEIIKNDYKAFSGFLSFILDNFGKILNTRKGLEIKFRAFNEEVLQLVTAKLPFASTKKRKEYTYIIIDSENMGKFLRMVKPVNTKFALLKRLYSRGEIKKFFKTWKDYLKACGENIEKLLNRGKTKEYNYSIPEKEKSYILGYRAGDLYVKKVGKQIVAEVSTTRAAMIHLFISLFAPYGKIIFDHPGNKEEGKVLVKAFLPYDKWYFMLSKNYGWIEYFVETEETFFSFLAGFFDAEGSIKIIRKKRGGFGVHLTIKNKDFKLIKLLWKKLQEYGYKCYIVKVKGKAYDLTITSKSVAIEVLKKLPLRHFEKIVKKWAVLNSKTWEEVKKWWNWLDEEIEEGKKELKSVMWSYPKF